LAEWLREPRARAIVVGLLSILYDLERQMISDRTKAGLERARMQGKVVGRPRKQVDRREVDKLLKLGVPRTKIAKMLGVSPRTLKRRIVEWSSQGRA
ncbi:MAG: helix-turn-helix domain-containing protein, partial [Conexivisphaera sp.]